MCAGIAVLRVCKSPPLPALRGLAVVDGASYKTMSFHCLSFSFLQLKDASRKEREEILAFFSFDSQCGGDNSLWLRSCSHNVKRPIKCIAIMLFNALLSSFNTMEANVTYS